jgi:MYXO-CTERM domain-containing protein
VPVASAVVAAVTPVGPELYTAVAAVGSRSQYFAEWGSPDWTSWEYGALALLLVLTGLAMWRRRRSSWLEVVLVALAVAFAVYSERTVPVAAAMIAPLLAGPLQDLLGRRTPVDRRERLVVGGGALAALVVLAVAVPFTSADPPGEAASMEAAVAALPPGTKVLDDWGQGGYVMWRYPQLDLMMHGYGDTFTTDELRRNTELIVLGPGWEESLHESGTRVALLRPWSRLAVVLRAQGWRTVLESDDYRHVAVGRARRRAGVRLRRLRPRPSARAHRRRHRCRRPRRLSSERPGAPRRPTPTARRRPRARRQR